MYTVLLVDDEELERKVLGFTLQNSGLPVEIVGEAANGRECLELVRLTNPDLIIMDIKMPGINGIEATKRVRELHLDPEVIILTAYSKFNYSQQAIKAQATDYLLKPLQPQELIKAVSQAIERIARKKLQPGPLLDMSGYEEQLRLGNLEQSKQRLAQLLELLAEQEPDASPAVLQSFGWQLLVISVQTVLAEGVDPKAAAPVQEELSEGLKRVSDLSGMAAWGEHLAEQCAQLLQKQHPAYDQALVRKAMDYLERNFSDDLSLNQVAAHVHLSSAYLSRIFTKKTGTNFTEYLAKVRLKNAKHLLRTADDSIDRIAILTGFSSNSYFTSVFKKYEGITPSDYRAKCRG